MSIVLEHFSKRDLTMKAFCILHLKMLCKYCLNCKRKYTYIFNKCVFNFNSREEFLDIEVAASGFTKNMDQLLLHEIGMIDNIEKGSEEENYFYENEKEEVDHLAERVAELMKEESSTILDNNPPDHVKTINVKSDSEEYVSLSENEDCESIVSSKVCYSDIHSVQSMTTTTTIPPEVIRDRVKKSLEKRQRATVRHRNLAKGEASAVNRQRRENKNTIKDSFGIWG